MSTVTFTGNVGDVQLNFTASGRAVCNVSVAENHRRKDQNGQWVDDGVTWRRVAFWERKAEAVADEIVKGDMVIVTGDERLREFEAKDGSKGKSLEVNGREIGKLVLPKRDGQPPQQQQGGQPAANPPAAWGDQSQQSSQSAQNAWGGGSWDNPQQGTAPF